MTLPTAAARVRVRAYEGVRTMTAGQCRARYSATHPFRCDRAAGHHGPHEDRTADAPSILHWRDFATVDDCSLDRCDHRCSAGRRTVSVAGIDADDQPCPCPQHAA